MSNYLEEYRCKVETLSPLHIGDGSRLTSIDHVFSMNKVYVIDYDKFYERLERQRLVDRFIEYIERVAGRQGLEDFLKMYRLFEDRFLEEVSGYVTRFVSREKKSVEIATCMKNLHKKLYIPGTEVKGAVRVALLCDILSRDGNVNRVIEGLRGGVLNREYIDGFLRPRIKKATGDLGRLMRFSDSEPLSDIVVANMYRVSLTLKNVIPLTLAEIIPTGAKTSLRLTIVREEKIIKELGGEILIERILNACRFKSRRIIELQKAVIRRALEESTATSVYVDALKHLDDSYSKLLEVCEKLSGMEMLLRIGGGQGLYSTTILPVLIGVDGFRQLITSKSARMKEAPKYVKSLSRLLTPYNMRPFNVKVVEADGVYMPLGWIRVVFERV